MIPSHTPAHTQIHTHMFVLPYMWGHWLMTFISELLIPCSDTLSHLNSSAALKFPLKQLQSLKKYLLQTDNMVPLTQTVSCLFRCFTEDVVVLLSEKYKSRTSMFIAADVWISLIIFLYHLNCFDSLSRLSSALFFGTDFFFFMKALKKQRYQPKLVSC